MSSKPRPLKLRMPPPCAPEALELQFIEFVLLQCFLQAVFQASASETADFLRAPQPVFFRLRCQGCLRVALAWPKLETQPSLRLYSKPPRQSQHKRPPLSLSRCSLADNCLLSPKLRRAARVAAAVSHKPPR